MPLWCILACTVATTKGLCGGESTQCWLVYAGDATHNIMWRLNNGEAPKGLNTEAFVIQAGEVDLVLASLKARLLPSAVIYVINHPCNMATRQNG